MEDGRTSKNIFRAWMSRKPYSDVTVRVQKLTVSLSFPLSHNMMNITLYDEAGDGTQI